jgi:hypothetical protein
MSDLLSDNPDVMGALLAALCDPGRFTPRAPMEPMHSWQCRAVIEHAAPYILEAERESNRQLAITGTAGMASAEECPVVFTPRDSEFCAQCTCDQAARHGGHHHCPHCGVWYTLASDVKRATATEGGGDHG